MRSMLRGRSKTSSRSKLEPLYRKRKEEYLSKVGCCEICKCNPTFTLDLHHKAGRSGSSLNAEGVMERNLVNSNTFMALCRPCHDQVHKFPKMARENGYLI